MFKKIIGLFKKIESIECRLKESETKLAGFEGSLRYLETLSNPYEDNYAIFLPPTVDRYINNLVSQIIHKEYREKTGDILSACDKLSPFFYERGLVKLDEPEIKRRLKEELICKVIQEIVDPAFEKLYPQKPKTKK